MADSQTNAPAVQSRESWGMSSALTEPRPRSGWIDLLIVVGMAGLIWGIVDLAHQWTHELRPAFDIDINDPWTLPKFTFFSLMRGMIAYVISLGFTLVYGYWAAKDAVAERVLVPLLDILQSIPVLSFLPGLVLALVALFPRSNVGLELAAILMIFTGQAWNMTFSYYHSLKSLPPDLREVARVYDFNRWQTLRWLELPYATMGLVWNSMMSMAGGWFFLMINESFKLGDRDFRLPGIGSYMAVAVEEGRYDSMLWAILAMVVMIVGLDQLLWRPVVVWAQKFRLEDSGQQPLMTSWFLDFLRGSRIVRGLEELLGRLSGLPANWGTGTAAEPRPAARRWKTPRLSLIVFALLLLVLMIGAWKLLMLLRSVTGREWLETVVCAFWTLTRVLVSTAIGTLWAVPAGLAIGLSPRLSRLLQPVIQVLASFPAPMLFPAVVALLHWAGVTLNFGSILLMLLGTQWYILFNVVAGAMAIPADLREAARSYRFDAWQRFWVLYVPAIFPYLVTGWVTAAGGAWNASIVAEFITADGQIYRAWGLGAQISTATYDANFPLLAASTLVMAMLVVTFNRTVWRRLYRLAAERFSLSK